ncbi:hypothetical protein [Arthrobacter sp. PsM3]|uniref:hypothetical protein n=1 Tax=Arthrobacter sp. PsM3 TaxID=3030531 RepID=UPI00263A768B|nr:hypothetical protein [Arthrobacter sp. PsM3]MDN4645978.1 hypothetical protein [Arthrobacter sp. PsM3]
MATFPGKCMTVRLVDGFCAAWGRNLADPIGVDFVNPGDPMSQLAVGILALVGRMELTYAIEPAARVRVVAAGKGKRSRRPCVVDPAKLPYAGLLRDLALSISEIVRASGITRSSLYRHLDAPGGRLAFERFSMSRPTVGD